MGFEFMALNNFIQQHTVIGENGDSLKDILSLTYSIRYYLDDPKA